MNGLIALGAGIAALTGIGGGIGIGIATGKAGTAIFGFVVALLIILFLGQ